MLLFSGCARRVRSLVLIGSFLLSLAFAATDVSALQSVTLAWNPSPDTNVIGYFVYYGTASGAYTTKTNVGNVTRATISGLTEGLTYYFVATAYNAAGLESDPSNEVAYTIPIPNQPPTLNGIASVTVPEDAGPQVVALSGITSGSAGENQALTVTATSSNPGLIPDPVVSYSSPSTAGTLTFSSGQDLSGTATITVTVNDGGSVSNTVSKSFVVTVTPVNDPPTLNGLNNVVIDESAGLQTVALTGISGGPANELQTVTITASSSNTGLIPNPTITYTAPNATGTLSFTPVPLAFGTATITVTVNDGQVVNSTVVRTFTVTVNPVNQAPTLAAINNVVISEDAAAQTVALSGISSGAANETQTLVVTATSSNPSLIPNPVITYTSPNATGSLSFTPAADAFGTASITVTVNDGQATSNTVSRVFTITVNPVNDPPTLDAIANVTVDESSAPFTVALSGITAGPANESQSVAITATSSNPGLIPNPVVSYSSPNTTGSIRLSPIAFAYGTATITVTANDGQTQNNTRTRTFTVTVNSVNQPPTLDPLPDLAIAQNAGTQTVNLSGITSGMTNENQTLTVTATSSNPALIPNPTVSYKSANPTGSISFAPVNNGSGSSTITVSVSDGLATTSRTFVVTVNWVNQIPTLGAISNQTVNEDSGPFLVNLTGISAGATNESQTLTITAVSSNPGLLPDPVINYTSPNATGTLTCTPVGDAFGTATVTVTVNDGASQNNTFSRTFTVTVNSINDPPTLATIPALTVDINSGPQVVTLSGISGGPANESQAVTITATSSNPGLIPNPVVSYSSPNPTGYLSFTPTANTSGSAVVTVVVSDGQSQNPTLTRTFTVTVNSGPSISYIADTATGTNTTTAPIAFQVSDTETPAGNLTVWAESSNPALLPVSGIVFGGSGTNRTVTLSPANGQAGIVAITISVSDGRLTATSTFQLAVQETPPPVQNLTIVVDGNGSLSPNISSQTLVPGKTYSVTAIPAAGQEFAGWSGSISSQSPTISFIMNPSVKLKARFVPSPYIPRQGTYAGLFFEDSQIRHETSGSFSLSVNPRGLYTGSLMLGGYKYPFKGRLSLDCQARHLLLRPAAAPVWLNFSIGVNNDVTGTVSDNYSTWTASLTGDRAVFHSKTNAAPWAGSYTLVMPPDATAPQSPAGYGYSAVKITPAGLVLFSGTLADGTKLAQKTYVSANGAIPLYAALYLGHGSLLSWLTLQNRETDDMNGALNWIKPADPVARYYPAGFTCGSVAVGSAYHVSTGTNYIINLPEGHMSFSGGSLAAAFANRISINGAARLVNLDPNPLKVTFNPANGTFSGTVSEPDTTVVRPIRGAVFQKTSSGFGMVLGTGVTGGLTLGL